jgi:predicted GIY-YIG superfamily endonuclease
VICLRHLTLGCSPTSTRRWNVPKPQALYVGISADPGKRFAQHRSDKPWWGDIRSMTVQPMATREAALEAEQEAIKNERPIHNKAHSDCTTWITPKPYNDSYAVVNYEAVEMVLLSVCDDEEIAKEAANGIWWAAAGQHTTFSLGVLECLPPDVVVEKANADAVDQAQQVIKRILKLRAKPALHDASEDQGGDGHQ